jgi:pimeloyl-ACP methyl ester carboxylesterase
MKFPDEVGGLAFFPIEFDKKARPVDVAQIDALLRHVDQAATSDLIVVSHGWNNDEKEALALYTSLITRVARLAKPELPDRTFAVLGVFWPSKRFADEDLIPGGAAAMGGADISESALSASIEALRGFFDSDDADELLDELDNLVPDLESDPVARTRFGEITRDLLGGPGQDEELNSEIPSEFFEMPGEEIINALAAPREEEFAIPEGGDSLGGVVGVGSTGIGGGTELGGASGVFDLFSGVRSGARTALNLTTYWTMKHRAGTVGSTGLTPVLQEVRRRSTDIRLHLVGHSFGGRLVTAAALGAAVDEPTLSIDTLVLLQAAFSHNGFAEQYEPGKDGFFRAIVTRTAVAGPLLVTHTWNDVPNRWAYPMASRLARQKASALGGPGDPFGAIGSNGAQNTPEAVAGALLGDRGTYSFEQGRIHNLEASAFIANHGSVAGAEVAHAIVSAIATT